MISFELGKEIKKDIFSSYHERGTRKKFWVPLRNRASDLRIPRSDALPLSHRDSTVSEVYYVVHMTHVLHTARISNIVVWILRFEVRFLMGTQNLFVPRSWRDEKTSFFISLPSPKTYHLSYFYQTQVNGSLFQVFFPKNSPFDTSFLLCFPSDQVMKVLLSAWVEK